MSDYMTDDEHKALKTEFNKVWTKNEENWKLRNECFFLLCDTEDEAKRERIQADLNRIEQLCIATETSLHILHAMIYPHVYDDDDDDYDGRKRGYIGDCC